MYETLKQLLWPKISIWESHTITIVVTSTMAMVSAAIFFRSSGSERKPMSKPGILLLIAAGLLPGVIVLGLMSWSGSAEREELRLAAATSSVDSGVLNELIRLFEKKSPYKVNAIRIASGDGLELAKRGGADAVLYHASGAEEKFIMDGYGLNRLMIMYNDWVILGPESPETTVPYSRDVVATLSSIQSQKLPFVSRGDKSATHARELELWHLAAVDRPGAWYFETGENQLATLRTASERQAYVLADRSTYVSNRAGLKLRIICEGDPRLFSQYGVVAANPAKIEGVNFKAAMSFMRFLASDEGQTAIASFRGANSEQALFAPMRGSARRSE
jgi:tungstate transport system substrate-binding protein